jgi:hypothetical protein
MPGQNEQIEPSTYDKEYTVVLKGFDCKVVPSTLGDGYYKVTLVENGGEVFSEDIPVPVEQDGETAEESIENMAQAAIDLFEGSRNTLDQGAGATLKASIQKKAFYIDDQKEEWFMSFKGTSYEEMAYQLLKQYYAADIEMSIQDDTYQELNDKSTDLMFQLNMLNLERMKASPANTKIVIVQGSQKSACYGAEAMRMFLDKFTASPLETQVVKLMSELLEVEKQIELHSDTIENCWKTHSDLDQQMEALAMEALQVNVLSKIPTEGIEAFPNMAGQLAELMEGVEMDAPLEPMSILSASRKRADEEPKDEPKRNPAMYPEWEQVVDRVIQKGETHLGLDPAEVELGEMPFHIGDKVSLSKKFDTVTPLTGQGITFDKGSKGYICSIHDGHGDCYVVAFEDGGRVNVPADYLSKKSS